MRVTATIFCIILEFVCITMRADNMRRISSREGISNNSVLSLAQGQDGYINTPVYWREDFVPGQTILGPCICEQMDTTLVVPKGWTLCVDGYHNLKIRADEVE